MNGISSEFMKESLKRVYLWAFNWGFGISERRGWRNNTVENVLAFLDWITSLYKVKSPDEIKNLILYIFDLSRWFLLKDEESTLVLKKSRTFISFEGSGDTWSLLERF